MDVFTALAYLLLGGFLGAVGQAARVIVGIKKRLDEAKKPRKKWGDWFDARRLTISLLLAIIVGAVAGVLGVMNYMGTDVTKETMIALIAIGYSGTDFIEGFMIRKDTKK